MIDRLAATLRTPAARDGAIVIGAQGISALIALGLSSFLFHKLSQSEQGALTAGTALSAALLQASDFGLALITIRLGAKYLSGNQHERARTLFRVTLLLRLVFALAVTAAALLLSGTIAGDMLRLPNGQLLIAAAALGVFGSALVWWGVDVAQARRKFGAYAAQQIFHALAKVLAVAAVFSAMLAGSGSATAENILFSIAAANLCAGAVSLVLTRNAVAGPRPSTIPAEHDSLRLFQFGAYACALSILAALNANADVLLVKHFLSEQDTAVFGCARQLTLVLNLLAVATITVLLPRAAALDSRAECAVYVRKALRVGIPLGIVTAGALAIAASALVPIFAGPNYVAAIPILKWLCIGQGIGIALTPLSLVFFPLRREGMLVFFNALQLAVQVGLSVWLIPAQKLEGAAFAVIGAKIAGAAAAIFLLVWTFKRADAVSKDA